VLEVLAVLLAIAIVTTFLSPQRFHLAGDRSAAAASDIDLLGAALETYRLDTGTYPTTAQGLAALVRMPTAPSPWNWRGPYVLRAIPTDPWRHRYVYRRDEAADGYLMLSYGADGRPGGQGEDADITVHR
jgi:general secretion pathway protein G